IIFFFARIYWKIFQPLTWGVRLMLIKNGEIILVRHTYRDGWYLPGGGLKRRETFQDAARREANEEAGATLGDLVFWGVYSNLIGDTSDHEVVMLCHSFELNSKTDREIAECRAFPLQELPIGTIHGVRKCVQQYLEGTHQPDVEAW
ncbi:MAG: NUDIX domain-containing protein, partial [Anaerolineae bacterium]|nr:NUDIX domain-containing protein [Anaerolineae bacterium]